MWSDPFPMGLSAQAIAGFGDNHPWDPSDLLRCIRYCEGRGIGTSELVRRMTGRSVQWDRLLPEWERLVALLKHEMDVATDGRAPRTYREMKRVLADGISCSTCSGSGRGEDCQKCKGTGRRGGGKCRADRCYSGADYCPECRGNGYTKRVPEPSRTGATDV
jgi:hypothetical protein